MASSIGRTVLWGGIYLLMLFSIMTPLNVLTLHVLLVPLLILLVVSDPMKSIMGIVALLIFPFLVLGGAGLFLSLLTLFYLLPAAAMAWQYRKEAGPGSAIIAGIVAFIAVILALLLISYSLSFNLSDFMASAIKQDPVLMPMLLSIIGSEAEIDRAIRFIVSLIPATIIIFSVYTTVAAHWLGRKLLSRYDKPVPKLKPMKEWRLPRSIIWYYLILLLLDLFFAFQPGSTMEVMLLNALPLLSYALALQGVGFLFYTADAKGWNRVLPVAGLVLVPFIPQLIAWIGVLDMAFPLRSRMKTNG